MDRDTALVFYRALMLICRYFEKRYGFGGNFPPPQYQVELEYERENGEKIPENELEKG